MSKHILLPAQPRPEVHPDDIYTPEMHATNRDLLSNYVGMLGVESESGITTPWMMTSAGVAQVNAIDSEAGYSYTAQLVRTSSGYFGLASHDVKDTVKVTPEGLDRRTHGKIYLPLSQHLGIMFLNTPISAGMMMGYPTLDYRPVKITKALEANLNNPKDQVIADRYSVNKLLARNPWTIRHWIGIKV